MYIFFKTNLSANVVVVGILKNMIVVFAVCRPAKFKSFVLFLKNFTLLKKTSKMHNFFFFKFTLIFGIKIKELIKNKTKQNESDFKFRKTKTKKE